MSYDKLASAFERMEEDKQWKEKLEKVILEQVVEAEKILKQFAHQVVQGLEDKKLMYKVLVGPRQLLIGGNHRAVLKYVDNELKLLCEGPQYNKPVSFTEVSFPVQVALLQELPNILALIASHNREYLCWVNDVSAYTDKLLKDLREKLEANIPQEDAK